MNTPTKDPAFIHLRVHSEFSITDGFVRIDPLLKAVKESGGVAIGLTDRMNLFGGVRFYTHATKAGLKPILGCDLALFNRSMPSQPDVLTVYCMNREGYRNLCVLLSRAYLEPVNNQRRGQVRLEWLENGGADHLIAITGGPHGALARHFQHELPDLAKSTLLHYKKIFGGTATANQQGGSV